MPLGLLHTDASCPLLVTRGVCSQRVTYSHWHYITLHRNFFNVA